MYMVRKQMETLTVTTGVYYETYTHKNFSGIQGVSNVANLHTRSHNLCNLTKITPRLWITPGITRTGGWIYNSRIGCNILVLRVIIRIKVQLGYKQLLNKYSLEYS